MALSPDLASQIRQLYESAWAEGKRWTVDLAQAEALLKAHLETEPDCVPALTSLGAVLSDTGRHAAAITELRRAVALKSDDANTYYNLAAALMNTDGRGRDSAMRYFRKADEHTRDPLTLRAYFDPQAH